MSKFNKTKPIIKIAKEVANHPDATVNEEFGLAFDASPKQRLVLQVLTCLVNEPKFYGTKEAQGTQIIADATKVVKEDPVFVINLAKIARNEFHLRSVPMVLLAVIAHNVKGKGGLYKELAEVISRADELVESLSAYQVIYGKTKDGQRDNPIPSVLKKAVALAFKKFDEYALAKYNRDGDIKLRDALRIVISQLQEKDVEKRKLFQKVLDNKLSIPETWETVISGAGSTKENWERVTSKMGFMALLRNLRNFEEKKIDDAILKSVLDKLSDPKEVAKSKQFPFRFYSAYQNVTTGKIKQALTTALNHSASNIPRFKGITYIAADNSGSMTGCTISKKSEVKCFEIADLMTALAGKICDNPITVTFSDRLQVLELDYNDSIMTNTLKLNRSNAGGATYAYLIMDYLLQNKIKVDRIILLSDMQCYNDDSIDRSGDTLAAKFKLYKKTINPKVIMYSIDLQGYGTLQFPQDDKNVVNIAGWSDAVFKFIEYYEKGGKTMIDYVQNYKNKKDEGEQNE